MNLTHTDRSLSELNMRTKKIISQIILLNLKNHSHTFKKKWELICFHVCFISFLSSFPRAIYLGVGLGERAGILHAAFLKILLLHQSALVNFHHHHHHNHFQIITTTSVLA